VRFVRRPGFRFVVEAAAILLAALIAGMRDVGWPGIIAAVAVVWVIAALTEYSLSTPKRARPPRAATAAALPVEPPDETVRVLPREPQPEPVPYEVPLDDAAPEPEPVSDTVSGPEPQRWNIWDLERAVRDGGEVSEEQEFLLMYLRDYADPDGLLPLDFDGLVRESFPDALAVVAQ
jgi:hypothetical protein